MLKFLDGSKAMSQYDIKVFNAIVTKNDAQLIALLKSEITIPASKDTAAVTLTRREQEKAEGTHGGIDTIFAPPVIWDARRGEDGSISYGSQYVYQAPSPPGTSEFLTKFPSPYHGLTFLGAAVKANHRLALNILVKEGASLEIDGQMQHPYVVAIENENPDAEILSGLITIAKRRNGNSQSHAQASETKQTIPNLICPAVATGKPEILDIVLPEMVFLRQNINESATVRGFQLSPVMIDCLKAQGEYSQTSSKVALMDVFPVTIATYQGDTQALQKLFANGAALKTLWERNKSLLPSLLVYALEWDARQRQPSPKASAQATPQQKETAVGDKEEKGSSLTACLLDQIENEHLYEAYTTPDKFGNLPLVRAAKTKNVAMTKRLLETAAYTQVQAGGVQLSTSALNFSLDGTIKPLLVEKEKKRDLFDYYFFIRDHVRVKKNEENDGLKIREKCYVDIMKKLELALSAQEVATQDVEQNAAKSKSDQTPAEPDHMRFLGQAIFAISEGITLTKGSNPLIPHRNADRLQGLLTAIGCKEGDQSKNLAARGPLLAQYRKLTACYPEIREEMQAELAKEKMQTTKGQTPSTKSAPAVVNARAAIETKQAAPGKSGPQQLGRSRSDTVTGSAKAWAIGKETPLDPCRFFAREPKPAARPQPLVATAVSTAATPKSEASATQTSSSPPPSSTPTGGASPSRSSISGTFGSR